MGRHAIVQGGRVYFRKAGRRGRPIVMLHGVFTSSFLWRDVQRLLSADYRTYALDLPGGGKSDRPASGDYSCRAQAGAVDAFMDELGLQNTVIACHGESSRIGQAVAQFCPDKISGLIIVNGVFHEYGLSIDARVIAKLAELPQLFPALGRADCILDEFLSQALRERLRLDDVRLNHVIGEYMKSWNGPDGKMAFARLVTGFAENGVAAPPRRIDAETLIVWGARDSFLPVEAAERLRLEVGPRAHLKILPDCGHFPQEENPRAVAESIMDFLRGRHKEFQTISTNRLASR